jgi:kynurenine formamidase
MRVKLVDLSHLMNVHTPGWVGYAGNKMYYAQNLQTKMIVAQRIDMALHVGTHIDGAMHGADGMGDMASYPLDFLVGPGAVVDVSAHMDDWAVITPQMIEAAPVDVREGHPDYPHWLASLLGGPAAAGPGALFLHASWRQI